MAVIAGVLELKREPRVDRWDRPVYISETNNFYVDIDLGNSETPNMHSTTSEGEPLSPVKSFKVVKQFQIPE